MQAHADVEMERLRARSIGRCGLYLLVRLRRTEVEDHEGYDATLSDCRMHSTPGIAMDCNAAQAASRRCRDRLHVMVSMT